ncbi:GDSL-type esterase/lipase family protein [Chitinophaga sp. sic0106]|uniref:GDSL-type esterase/lipase family protein n=1 Tax=Chitinophaga sp. sic0106 TaxID=2854785 RepID=UPI001C44EA9B|nr:GDSL-type esterase/lipase family protein [Chitinophaga sp. sic0106]MBV7529234.1 prolyl oligopeptidase family serine peptidase [Chitinophaga sp. sic0106]
MYCKNKRLHAAMMVCMLLLPIFSFAGKIVVSCLGTSITYGAGMYNREQNNFPRQLQYLLGNDYQVNNYGASGATLLHHGNLPYDQQQVYQKALQTKSDIIFLEFGTNDSKAVNRPYFNEFVNDYKQLIARLRSQHATTSPRIILLMPVPAYLTDTASISDSIIRRDIQPMIRQVAYETGVEIIDLYPSFAGQKDLLPDQIHPSSIGAALIARRLYEAVSISPDKNYDIFTRLKMPVATSSFYGYACADFTLNGRNCKVVKPRLAAKDKPWIWRARFWGHEPQTDIAMLERGYHIVYCDVAEMFGSPACISLWNKFYQLLTSSGLAKKVILEGMSRGGMYIYNWALANPGKVAAIYADAPVLDITRWPGHNGAGPGSKENWEIFKQQYHLTEAQAVQYNHSPLNNAAAIAKLGFPMLHVVGDADSLVLVSEHTTPFEQQVKAAGGNITVIHKPGIGHHPHSLANPRPIVEFMLAATGHKINFARKPIPAAEYRSAAGWKKDCGWWEQHADIDSLLLAQKGSLDIVFAGNSITQGTGGHRTKTTSKAGYNAFDSTFGKWNWECAGISGDRVQNLLWRFQNGTYAAAEPKVMVVTIGVNNFGDNDSAAEIAAGILDLVKWVRKNIPATKLVLSGLLPTGFTTEDPRRIKYDGIQRILADTNHNGYTYLPLTGTFTDEKGNLDATAYAKDGIHLTGKGYRMWAKALEPVVVGLLK